MKDRILLKIIKEICEEENIEMNTYSFGYIIQLIKNKKIKYIIGSNFDINTEASGRIMCDKAATYTVLSAQNIPIVEHQIIFNPTTRSEYIFENSIWETIFKYFNDNNKKIVVKVNDGFGGMGVYRCDNTKYLEKTVSTIFKNEDILSICPYYDIKNEYRVFCLGEECLLTYTKHKPQIIGNGINTVKDLIEIQHKDRKINIDNELDLNYIPEEGEIIFLSWKFNLSGGARVELLIDENKKTKIHKLATEVAKGLNIGFATVDIIETVDGELKVLEVNSGIGITKFIENVTGGYNLAKNIYKKAIKKMFEQ